MNKEVKSLIPLVIRHSNNYDSPVLLFETEEEAKAKLKSLYEEEYRTMTEDGKVEGENMQAYITEDYKYAVIVNILDYEKIETEWVIGRIA